MKKIDRFFITIILFVLLIDNAKQSKFKQTSMAFKTIGNIMKNPISNSIKKPIIKTFSNTIKNSVKMLHQNRNTIKNLAFGLGKQGGKYMRNFHNFGSKSVKYLGKKGIKMFKYTAPQTARGGKHLFRTESKKNIYMGSAAQMSGKQFSPVIKRSFGQINGKEVRSLINMVSKSKPYLPLVFATGGLGKLAQLNLLPEDNDLNLTGKDPNNIEKVEQHKQKTKLHGFEFYKSMGSPKYICAPMVEQSQLPWRIICRKYGTELCYSPMLHAKQMITHPKYKPDQFSTNAEDNPLIVQLAGDDPKTVLEAAQMIQGECNAVDINLGCPQQIGKKGNFGSFLLTQKQTIFNIVRTLHDNLDIPVTCKIRILPDEKETQDLVKMIEDSGCSILTVHARTKEQNKQKVGPANWDIIKLIKENISIPVFSNGGIYHFKDVQNCLDYTGCDGVMSSESLLENPALFYNNGEIQDLDKLAEEYLHIWKEWTDEQQHWVLKAHLFRMLHSGLAKHPSLRDDLEKAIKFEEYQSIVNKLAVLRKDDSLISKFGYYERHWHNSYIGDDKDRRSIQSGCW